MLPCDDCVLSRFRLCKDVADTPLSAGTEYESRVIASLESALCGTGLSFVQSTLARMHSEHGRKLSH